MSANASVSRRAALQLVASALACPLLCRCSGPDATSPPADDAVDPDGVTIAGAVVEIDVARVPQLATGSISDTAVVFLRAGVIVVRRAADTFTAYSSVCPHAGCGVSVVRPSRLECPCHGSAFDFGGERIEGPAPAGLTRLASAYDPINRRLRIERLTA